MENGPFDRYGADVHDLAGDQAVGVRCRESLLELIGVAQDAAMWTDTPPQSANCRACAEIICNDLLPNATNKECHGALKGALDNKLSPVWQIRPGMVPAPPEILALFN